jgi:hypothetical protein
MSLASVPLSRSIGSSETTSIGCPVVAAIFRTTFFSSTHPNTDTMIDQINSTTRSNDHSFYVVLHDVAPCFSKQISVILDALAPLINTRIAAAVVPSWHGKPITSDDGSFIQLVGERFDDLLLHGFFHSRSNGRGLVSLMTGGADEFNGSNT